MNYWTSFSQQRGILLNVAQGIRLSAEHQLNLIPYTDGLKRRPRADWSISYISSVLATSDIWIQSAVMATPPVPETTPADRLSTLGSDSPAHTPSPQAESGPPPLLHSAQSASSFVSGRDTLGSRGEGAGCPRNMEKSFFFCVEEVLYTRDSYQELGRPTHRLVIHGARGAWTQSNRDMFFALYDSWRRAQILRKNVSSDALKLFHNSAEKSGGGQAGAAVPPEKVGGAAAASSNTPFTSPTPASQPTTSSPFSWGNPKGTGSLLDRLLQVSLNLKFSFTVLFHSAKKNSLIFD